ncbi:MAG: hypothetical protein K2X38_19195 [Gemmataceae bacterium]|nr:hypothetical protein [Gemmataceae bacterium]
MRHGCRTLVALACIAFLGGCAKPRRPELVEVSDAQYRDALTELMRTENRNNALTRDDPSRPGVAVPEIASIPATQRIALGRLTGGIDRDGLPGDELLSVVIEPQDHAAKPLRTPGNLEVIAYSTSADAKEPIATWSMPEEKLAPLWKQGLLNAGYHLELAWPTPPSCDQMRLVARLTTADGRVYETAKELKISPPSNMARHGVSPEPNPLVRIGHQNISIGKPMPLQASAEVVVPPQAIAPPPLLP